MQIGETLRVALESLRVNPMRSLLTMLGIVIGVGSVIAMTALGNGAQRRVQERIASLGTTLLQIDGAHWAQGGVAVANPVRLTEKDAQYLTDHATLLAEIEPQQDRHAQVTWRNQNTNVQVTAAAANFLDVRRFEIDVGRMFTPQEDAARKRVAVIGGDVVSLLNMPSAEAAIGDNIRIGGLQFEIVGVLKSKGSAGGFGEPDSQIVIPFETGRFRVFGTPYLNDLFVTAVDESHVKEALIETEMLLRKSHHILPDKPDDFRIRSSDEFLTALTESTTTFRLLLGGIAAVSLLVGGIGIMNIMLVVVTERTREIGIRKALGATRRLILLQFLIEAVVLCIVGGLLGAGAGVGGALAFQRWFGWATSVGPSAVAIAVLFAGLIGVMFGVWPAMRASRLDPIEALRFE